MLGNFTGTGWCGVEVIRIDGSGGEGGVFGVPPPGLWFGDGRCGSYFLTAWCLICAIGVYSCFAGGSGEDRHVIHPRRFPFDIKLYREDWCVFILRVCPIESVGDKPVVYMSAEVLGSEGFCLPFLNVIDGVVGEVFMVVNC